MHRYIVAIVMALIIALPVCSEAAGKKKSKARYWGNLRGKIHGITPRKKTRVTTAVGGVRGAKDESADSVYWKGREHAEIDEEELLKFTAAVDFAMNGENEKAMKELEEFLSAYPDSPLRVDALEALATLKEEPAVEAEPAAETESADEAATAAPAEEPSSKEEAE
jgi:hypothetical protein